MSHCIVSIWIIAMNIILRTGRVWAARIIGGKYDEKSFDKMFNFFIDRIEKVFLSRACQIADDINFSLNQYGSVYEMMYGTPKITPDNIDYIIL